EGRLAVPEQELLAVIYDRRRGGSLASLLDTLCRVAGTVRDRISRDLWRVVQELADIAGSRAVSSSTNKNAARAQPRSLSEALEQLDRVVLAVAAYGGLSNDSVTRGDGWRFLDLGRKLERALQTVSLLRNTLVFPAPPEAPLLEAVLEIADSSM